LIDFFTLRLGILNLSATENDYLFYQDVIFGILIFNKIKCVKKLF